MGLGSNEIDVHKTTLIAQIKPLTLTSLLPQSYHPSQETR